MLCEIAVTCPRSGIPGTQSEPVPILTVGMHISARKPSQRWPVERYAELIRAIVRQADTGVLLFWSPGPEGDAKHPGDDEKAAQIEAALRGVRLLPIATQRLEDLIALNAMFRPGPMENIPSFCARKNGREIMYVTERCVFRLVPEGLLLAEVAPGVDIQRDILDQMGFMPILPRRYSI
mgnify:CR=1 FL=1